jgi:hypothetical protein
MPYVGREANSFTTVVDVTVSDDLTVTDDATIGGDLTVTGNVVSAGIVQAGGGNAPTKGFQLARVNGTLTPRITNDASDQTCIRPGVSGGGVAFNNFANSAGNMTIADAGDIKIERGDIFFGTSGKGIVLGATSNTAANTLSDYEEGTWTPVMTGDGGSAGSASTTVYGARYTKTGNLVTVMCYIRFANIGSYSGNVAISGLPFTSANNGVRTAGTIDFLKRVELVDAFNYSGNIVPNTTVVQISRIVSDASVKTQAQVSAFNDNLNEIIFSCSYNA